jgi:[ribosomal protein S18]-alanine N-acetyltransferase
MTPIVEITTKNFHVYIDQILEIENRSFVSPWSRDSFQSEMKNPASFLWALIVNEAVVGYVCFWVFDSEIQIVNIAVNLNQRGQGFGRFLLEKLIEVGITKGVRSVWLEVRPSNLTAKGLYQKLGFEQMGRRPRYYRDTGEDAIVMSLKLARKGVYPLASN